MVFRINMSLQLFTIDTQEVRTPSTKISADDLRLTSMQKFIDELIDAMIRFQGIGIAAPQVGHCIQIIILHKDYTKTTGHLVVVNPRLVYSSSKTNHMEEGCLSVPGIYGSVARATKVRVKGWDRHGKSFDCKAKGMLAKIFQHEIDHLAGVLFIDRASKTHNEIPSAIAARHSEHPS